MFKSLKKPADAYHEQYRGSTMVLKISGKQILHKDIIRLIDDVRRLTTFGIKFLIVFGGGEQINQQWRGKHGEEERPMINGVAVTTPEIRTYAVRVYEEIRLRLRELFPEIVFIEPSQVHCTLKPDRQLTGSVESIDDPPHRNVVAFGFIGTVDDIAAVGDETLWNELHLDKRVNVNADEVTTLVAEATSENRRNIQEIMMITETKGVLDSEGNIVPVLTIDALDRVLAGTHPKIQVRGGMVKKLQELRRIAKKYGKAVTTDVTSVASEIENYQGSGTLVFDPDRCTMDRLSNAQEPIFDTVYGTHAANGTYRERSETELAELKQNHWLLTINGSPLGGISLIPHGQWTEFGTYWAEPIGNGLGQLVLNAAYAKAGQGKTYACALKAEAIMAFRRNPNFRDLGSLSKALLECPDDVPEHLARYLVQQRDPHLFLGIPFPASRHVSPTHIHPLLGEYLA